MNPDRLRELLRQRELVQSHLAWLDREITEAGAGSPPPRATAADAAQVTGDAGGISASPGSPPASSGLPPASEFASKLTTASAIAGYEPDPGSAARRARRGCFVAFAAAFLLLFALLLGIYLLRYRDHPLLFAPGESSPAAEPATTSPPTPPRK